MRPAAVVEALLALFAPPPTSSRRVFVRPTPPFASLLCSSNALTHPHPPAITISVCASAQIRINDVALDLAFENCDLFTILPTKMKIAKALMMSYW